MASGIMAKKYLVFKYLSSSSAYNDNLPGILKFVKRALN